jgi:hypothetical protein
MSSKKSKYDTYVRRCDCCVPFCYFTSKQAYYYHINRDKINTKRNMKRSSNNISTTSTSAVSVDPVSPFDRSVSLAVNQLIKTATILVDVKVAPDLIYTQLKSIVKSNKGKAQAIAETFKEKRQDLKAGT